MTYLLIVPAIVFAVGLALLFSARRRLAQTSVNPMIKASQVAALAEMGSDRVELTGVARAGERGVLKTPGGLDALWYRTAVHGLYLGTDANGAPSSDRLTLSDECSSAPIVLEEEDGFVVVDVKEAEIDSVAEHSFPLTADDVAALGLDVTDARLKGDVEFVRSEWVIAEGTTLFVSGRPVKTDDQVGIGRPDDGHLLVSTRSGAQLVRSATTRQRNAMVLCVLAALTAAGIVVFL